MCVQECISSGVCEIWRAREGRKYVAFCFLSVRSLLSNPYLGPTTYSTPVYCTYGYTVRTTLTQYIFTQFPGSSLPQKRSRVRTYATTICTVVSVAICGLTLSHVLHQTFLRHKLLIRSPKTYACPMLAHIAGPLFIRPS